MRTLDRGVMPKTTTADSAAARLWRALPIPLALVLGLLAVLGALTFAVKLDPAVDITQYLNATRRWLDTGTPYLPQEVAAPFQFGTETFLHPPISLLLFAPFLVLPIALWWAIPIGVVLW